MSETREMLQAERTGVAISRTTAVQASRRFRIEAILAVNPRRPEWSCVSASAFVDRRTDSLFMHNPENADLFGDGSTWDGRDGLDYADQEVAQRCARRLAEFAGWRHEIGPEPWRRPDRPVWVRVVEVQEVKSCKVVMGAVGSRDFAKPRPRFEALPHVG